jgi:hypothetical protein
LASRIEGEWMRMAILCTAWQTIILSISRGAGLQLQLLS